MSAAVDLSWTAADFNDVPLFVFEVESTASAGLANNALKVLGKPLEALAKPLFFFHIVVKAGALNERIADAQRFLGSHNYRVYRLSDATQRVAIVIDALRQHRRVSNRIDIVRVMDALVQDSWISRDGLDDILSVLLDLRFDTAYLYAFARLASRDLSYLPHFARRAREVEAMDEVPEREGYSDGPGDYIAGLLEVALIVAAGVLPDREGPAALEAWATRSGTFPRTIDAAFGLSRDYDGFVLGIAPFHYALAAAVLERHPLSRAWVVRDLSRLLRAEDANDIAADFKLPAAIWLAHLLAASQMNSSGSGGLAAEEVQEMWTAVEQCVEDAGGVPSGWIEEPPSPEGDLGYYGQILAEVSHRGPLTGVEELSASYRNEGREGSEEADGEAIQWCLRALFDVNAYLQPTSALVRLIAANHCA